MRSTEDEDALSNRGYDTAIRVVLSDIADCDQSTQSAVSKSSSSPGTSLTELERGDPAPYEKGCEHEHELICTKQLTGGGVESRSLSSEIPTYSHQTHTCRASVHALGSLAASERNSQYNVSSSSSDIYASLDRNNTEEEKNHRSRRRGDGNETQIVGGGAMIHDTEQEQGVEMAHKEVKVGAAASFENSPFDSTSILLADGDTGAMSATATTPTTALTTLSHVNNGVTAPSSDTTMTLTLVTSNGSPPTQSMSSNMSPTSNSAGPFTSVSNPTVSSSSKQPHLLTSSAPPTLLHTRGRNPKSSIACQPSTRHAQKENYYFYLYESESEQEDDDDDDSRGPLTPTLSESRKRKRGQTSGTARRLAYTQPRLKFAGRLMSKGGMMGGAGASTPGGNAKKAMMSYAPALGATAIPAPSASRPQNAETSRSASRTRTTSDVPASLSPSTPESAPPSSFHRGNLGGVIMPKPATRRTPGSASISELPAKNTSATVASNITPTPSTPALRRSSMSGSATGGIGSLLSSPFSLGKQSSKTALTSRTSHDGVPSTVGMTASLSKTSTISTESSMSIPASSAGGRRPSVSTPSSSVPQTEGRLKGLFKRRSKAHVGSIGSSVDEGASSIVRALSCWAFFALLSPDTNQSLCNVI